MHMQLQSDPNCVSIHFESVSRLSSSDGGAAGAPEGGVAACPSAACAVAAASKAIATRRAAKLADLAWNRLLMFTCSPLSRAGRPTGRPPVTGWSAEYGRDILHVSQATREDWIQFALN